MSVDSFVFFRDERLPSIQEWQQGLDQAGTGVVLDQVEELRDHTGYLPVRFKGQDSGFEWFYGPVADTFGKRPAEVGDRSHVVDFVTHSDIRELICAMLAGAVLAKLADGLVFDEESDSFIDGDAALEIARHAEISHM